MTQPSLSDSRLSDPKTPQDALAPQDQGQQSPGQPGQQSSLSPYEARRRYAAKLADGLASQIQHQLSTLAPDIRHAIIKRLVKVNR